jgi:hypothetical protein
LDSCPGDIRVQFEISDFGFEMGFRPISNFSIPEVVGVSSGHFPCFEQAV